LSNTRLRAITYWATPPLLMLALYWRGFFAWFQKDDFAWLSLPNHVHSTRDLLWALFAPLAQGTIRTLSERAVFLSFTSLFGLNPLPFHVLAFVTCIATICLLADVATKLSGSRSVGFCAAIIWAVNPAIAWPLAWPSNYNELAWPFVMLLAFWFLLRYVETGERRFFIAQCITFVLGFFVLETNVVYPAIAAAFAITSPEAVKRGLLKKVLPLFAISLLYIAIHFSLAPLPVGGPYQLHWDAKIFQTFTMYWGWALGPGQGRLIGIVSTAIRSTCVWSITLGLFAFLIRRDRETYLFPAWFVITLAPLLPLRDHLTEEYLTTPALGLAMWGGWAIVSAWRSNALAKIAAVALLAIYVGFSILVGNARVHNSYDSSIEVRDFVHTVTSAAQANPGKMILLKGVTPNQFYSAVYDHVFLLYGFDQIYVAPENRPAIAADPYFTAIDEFFATPAIAEEALRTGRAIVVDVSTH
jgi:hypothetical protein